MSAGSYRKIAGVNDATGPAPDPLNPPTSSARAAEPIPSPSEDRPAAVAEPPARAPSTDGSAVAALVLAILSWFVLPIVGSVIALVLARRAELAIAAAPFEVTGSGVVTAARWVAWTHLVVVAMVIAFVAAFVIAVWIGR